MSWYNVNRKKTYVNFESKRDKTKSLNKSYNKAYIILNLENKITRLMIYKYFFLAWKEIPL